MKTAKLRLANYDAAKRALDQAKAHDDVQKIADPAVKLSLYGKQSKNFALEQTAMEIRIRAERQHGLLKNRAQEDGLVRGRGGDRKSEKFKNQTGPQGPFDPKPVAALGFTPKQQKRQAALARVSDHEFEEDVKAGLTATEIIKKHAPPKAKPTCAVDEESMCGMSRIPDGVRTDMVVDFVEKVRHALALFQNGIGEYDIADLLKKFPPGEANNLLEAVDFVLDQLRGANLREWFSELKQTLKGRSS
jgi:hypothetical protein